MPIDPTPVPTPPPPSLHAEVTGVGPRVVLAHGFTQTGRVWGSLDHDLARDHQVVAVDMPGHGRSSDVRATLVDGALLLARAGGPAAYVGYSMGARFCLHLALARPEVVGSLVLISATAGIDDPDERRARRASDAALADQLDPGRPGDEPVPLEAFLTRWMDNPLFAGVDPSAAGLEERRRNSGPGLASSLRLAGTGTQLPLWGKLGRLDMPVLVVCGEADTKFTDLGRRLTEAIGPNADLAVMAGTGHAPHLQRPGAVADLVRSHLARTTSD
jgi:2-succinyl-6-hydroxy-2,4-cyclohexadiene-1-carboxylate synthase